MPELVGLAGRRALSRVQREFFASAARSIGRAREDELHATRIAAKRLRYTIEFFSSTLGPSRVTALGLLALLQDRLGVVADCEAFARFYARLEPRLPQDDARRAGIDARIAACESQRREAIDAVRALWRGGEYPPYPDMLAASISAALASPSSNPP